MEQRYFGMTMGQLIILAVLGFMACVLAGIAGSMALTMTSNPRQVAQPTYTLAPTQAPAPTSTAVPTITAIPDWNAFNFAEYRAIVWLPASYSGGDTTTSSETILQNLRAATEDEAFINDIQGLIALPEIKFFAFDTDLTNGTRFMYVGNEALDPDLFITMDDYLNRTMDNLIGGSERVVERQIVQLDRYPAGKLVIENKVPAGEGEAFVTMAVYLVRAGNTMWFINYRTGKSEYKGYQPIVEDSVNSFWAQP